MQKILVLGGSGFVGRHVCEQLTRLGVRATVPTRRAVNAQNVQHLPLVDVIEADVFAPRSLDALLLGHDAVVNLIAVLHGNAERFEQVHVQLPRMLATACNARGVRRVVHVSALGASPDAPSLYQRSKAQGEMVLAQAGLELTLLRPSLIFGAEDKLLNLFAKLQKTFPVMPLAGAQTQFQPVWVQDVAAAVVECLQSADAIGHTYECVGPDTFTLKELVQLSGQYAGVQRPVLALPRPLARLQALLMELAPGEPLMSRDNLDSLRVDNIASGLLPGLAELGITAASVHAIAPTYLGHADAQAALGRYRTQVRR
jgi:uncharacterized protein YbjT (DUF2867 family)